MVELVFDAAVSSLCVTINTTVNFIFEDDKMLSVALSTQDRQVRLNFQSAGVLIVESDGERWRACWGGVWFDAVCLCVCAHMCLLCVAVVIGLTMDEYSVVEKEMLEVQVNVSQGELGTDVRVILATEEIMNGATGGEGMEGRGVGVCVSVCGRERGGGTSPYSKHDWRLLLHA